MFIRARNGTGGIAMTHEHPSNEIVRKELLTAVIAGQKDVARVEIRQIDLAPSQQTGLHSHPCPVVGYVVSGTIRFQVAGEALQLLSAGSAFFEPTGRRIAHFDNASAEAPARFVAVYLLGADDRQLIEMLS
jgi:quercetin dioxygenase-like cupin family protein